MPLNQSLVSIQAAVPLFPNNVSFGSVCSRRNMLVSEMVPLFSFGYGTIWSIHAVAKEFTASYIICLKYYQPPGLAILIVFVSFLLPVPI